MNYPPRPVCSLYHPLLINYDFITFQAHYVRPYGVLHLCWLLLGIDKDIKIENDICGKIPAIAFFH